MLDNEFTRRVLDTRMPGLSSHPRVDEARGLKLPEVAGNVPEIVNEASLARVAQDLRTTARPETPSRH